MKDHLKAHLALATVAFLYGANYIIAKITLGSGLITPQGFIMLRVLTAGTLLWIVHGLFIKEKLERADIGYVAMLSIFGIAINQLCFFYGLKHTSAMHASLIMITVPVLVLTGSALLLGNKVNRWQICGIALGLIGAAILVYSASDATETATVLGDVFILINAISYALYLLLAKKVLMKYHPFTILKWLFAFGAVFIIPFGMPDLLAADFGSFEAKHWWSVAFVLLGATFLAYLFNAYALSKVKSSTVSFYLYFQPLIASGIAIAIGADTLSASKLQAAVLLFAGVYMVTKKGGSTAEKA